MTILLALFSWIFNLINLKKKRRTFLLKNPEWDSSREFLAISTLQVRRVQMSDISKDSKNWSGKNFRLAKISKGVKITIKQNSSRNLSVWILLSNFLFDFKLMIKKRANQNERLNRIHTSYLKEWKPFQRVWEDGLLFDEH